MTTAERIKEILDEHYMSAAALAREIGIAEATVQRWIKDQNAIKLVQLIKVAEYFNYSLDFICGRTEVEGQFNKSTKPDFPKRIKMLVENSKISKSIMAKELNICRDNFSDWINGSPPLSSSLIILADYFLCTVDYLVGLEN